MQQLTAVVLGATGLIGEQLVQQLLDDPAFSKIRILVRRPVQLSHAKLEIAIVDFKNLQDYEKKLGNGDCIFCCIGTTQAKVKGDKKLYREIDFNIAVDAAKIAIEAGFTKYLLVSSVGANASAKNFYLKLKGEVENAIASVGFKSFHVFRPSMLIGKRKELRLVEAIAQPVMAAVSIFLKGALGKYKAIKSEAVAKAMITAAKSNRLGKTVYHYEEIMDLTK
jgi:uncharacterized protein YbjT (DUF2867 family)